MCWASCHMHVRWPSAGRRRAGMCFSLYGHRRISQMCNHVSTKHHPYISQYLWKVCHVNRLGETVLCVAASGFPRTLVCDDAFFVLWAKGTVGHMNVLYFYYVVAYVPCGWLLILARTLCLETGSCARKRPGMFEPPIPLNAFTRPPMLPWRLSPWTFTELFQIVALFGPADRGLLQASGLLRVM